jgi:hypothetical protein
MPTLDFDQAWAEARSDRDPITVRAFGDEVVLPDELPAKVILLAERNRQRRQDHDLSMADVLEVLHPFVGAATVERWLDRGMSLVQAMELVGRCRRAYLERDNPPEDDSPGEASPGPGPGSGTSSTDGQPSKPTSPASTGRI